MKRRVIYPDLPPGLLLKFDPADWPAAEDDQDAFKQWREARKQFCELHGWPGGAVAMIQEHVRERDSHFHGPTQDVEKGVVNRERQYR